MRMNKITFSDDYFLLIINIIPLLLMWILWNKSARKWLHTLLSWFILIFDMIFNEHSVVWWFHFTFKLRLLFFLNWIFLVWLRTLSRILLTLQYQNEYKLTFLMIPIFKQIILSLYFSCGFCETNQVVSNFILYLIVYENLACSFL